MIDFLIDIHRFMEPWGYFIGLLLLMLGIWFQMSTDDPYQYESMVDDYTDKVKKDIIESKEQPEFKGINAQIELNEQERIETAIYSATTANILVFLNKANNGEYDDKFPNHEQNRSMFMFLCECELMNRLDYYPGKLDAIATKLYFEDTESFNPSDLYAIIEGKPGDLDV